MAEWWDCDEYRAATHDLYEAYTEFSAAARANPNKVQLSPEWWDYYNEHVQPARRAFRLAQERRIMLRRRLEKAAGVDA